MYIITIRYSVKRFEILSLYGLRKEEFGIQFCIYNYICLFYGLAGRISNFVSFAMSGSNNLAPGIALNILSSVFCEVTTKRTLLYKGNLDYFFRNKWIIHPGKCRYACSLFELKLEHKYNIYGGVKLIKYM